MDDLKDVSPESALAIGIWNRAALDAGGTAPRDGDSALAAMLAAHSLIMNGGVLHTVDLLDASAVAAACAGFEYFGLEPAAVALRRAWEERNQEWRGPEDDLEETLNQAYWAVVPDDRVLEAQFLDHLRAHPDAYAPLARAS